MDAATATLFIGGLLTVLGTLVNRLVDMIQQSSQWKRDKEKLTLEHNAAKERQIREQLQDIYANAVRCLSEIITIVNHEAYKAGHMQKDMPEKVGEAQKWLSLFVIYYYA